MTNKFVRNKVNVIFQQIQIFNKYYLTKRLWKWQ